MIVKNDKLAVTVRPEAFRLSELNGRHISHAIVVTNLNHHSLTSLEFAQFAANTSNPFVSVEVSTKIANTAHELVLSFDKLSRKLSFPFINRHQFTLDPSSASSARAECNEWASPVCLRA
ncbi:hypothetical protein [Bifidobacterium dentium]|uniref:hypothetical protein n=1 Tax=Bifidobacterium dentium TaxID=1689 RepID=UPI0018C1DA3C|nr:hypothetical protein [Bifidobacterium dentium]MBF9701929.1 hypothetical protein [Bifidobacterium dentium]